MTQDTVVLPSAAAGAEPSLAQVQALAGGDRVAWTTVVRWLQPMLDGWFTRSGSNDPEALSQETFIRMSRSIAQFTDGGAPELRAWAFAIARTVRIDAIRRASARPRTTPDSAIADSAETAPIERVVDAAPAHDEQVADTDRVTRLFAQLTDQQAELLRMRIHGDLTTEQAAAAMGLNLGQAKQLQRRALRRLAGLLADESRAEEAPPPPDGG